MKDNLQKIPLIVIGGPTAVGKTQLSIDIAKHFSGEIINGDRLQMYRALDIGTGKVTTEEMDGIPHHLLSFLNLNQNYDVSQFKEDATKCIVDIYERGKLPIVIGGSGLYLEGLLYHLEFGGEAVQDDHLRQQLTERLETEGAEVLWRELQQLDAEAASKIPIQNHRRIIRALEVVQLTGQKFSAQARHHEQQSIFNDYVVFLDRPRESLYERINLRVEGMVQQGLEEEVRALYTATKGELVASTQGIGYKEWWPYFAGTQSQEAVVLAIQQNSRRYAKRQLTWFRNRISNAHWYDVSDYTATLATVIQEIQQRFSL